MAYKIPRCQATPMAEHQVSFTVDGVECLRWHYGPEYPRPFFHPFNGPSGHALTRMGHPGAPNHEHHRGIWFAHHKALGMNFWADGTGTIIRQKDWLCYDDGDEHAAMAVLLDWLDGHDPQALLTQEVIAVMRPGEEGETFLELQTTFRPVAKSFEFGQTNFGFLAVRVAKSISAFFGGGQLTNSAGMQGEPNIFGKQSAWMDYSGPVPGGTAEGDTVEGITYFDHPSNPGHPTSWHVREDGWMGASPCMHEARVATTDNPLTLRYLLHAHRGGQERTRSDRLAAEFAARPAWRLVPKPRKHTSFEVAPVA